MPNRWMIAMVLALAPHASAAGASDAERLERLEKALDAARRQIESLEQQVEELRAREPATLPTARAEAPRRAEKPTVETGYEIGKGFSAKTSDGRFSLNVYNRFQGRYTYTDQDDPGSDDTSSFRVRRMKTVLKGNAFDPDLEYKLQVDWVDSPEIEDALLHWQPRHWAGIQGGQFKVPFNRQQLASSGSLQFVDRAITDAFFTLARDQGLAVTGRALGRDDDLLEWGAGIFNGNGLNGTSNENSDHLAVGRALFMPLGAFDSYVESDVADTQKPRVGIGAAGAFNSQADSTASQAARIFGGGRLGTHFGDDVAGRFDVTEATVDAHFKYRGFSALADFLWAEADPNLGPSKTAHGYNFQLGYFLLPKRLEAAFRYASIEREEDVDRGQHEVGGALGYFFLAHNLKLQADVRSVTSETPGAPDADTMEFRAQLQAIF